MCQLIASLSVPQTPFDFYYYESLEGFMNVLTSDITQCLCGGATYSVRLKNEIKMKNGYESNQYQNQDKKSLSSPQKKSRKQLIFG